MDARMDFDQQIEILLGQFFTDGFQSLYRSTLSKALSDSLALIEQGILIPMRTLFPREIHEVTQELADNVVRLHLLESAQ